MSECPGGVRAAGAQHGKQYPLKHTESTCPMSPCCPKFVKSHLLFAHIKVTEDPPKQEGQAQRPSEGVPRPAASAPPWALVRTAVLGPHSGPAASDAWAQESAFHKPSRALIPSVAGQVGISADLHRVCATGRHPWPWSIQSSHSPEGQDANEPHSTDNRKEAQEGEGCPNFGR